MSQREKESRTPQAHSTSSLSITTHRKACVETLVGLNLANPAYCYELESRLYDLTGRPQTFSQFTGYFRKYVQLVYNLQLPSGQELFRMYTPAQLLFLESEDLNSKVKQERQESELQQKRYKDVEHAAEDAADAKDEEGAIQCPKCKSSKKITIVPRQLRSADEPCSLILTCNNCGKGWRIG